MSLRRRSSVGGLVISILLIGLVGGAWWQRQAIFDKARLYNYQPPAVISKLADNTTMTEPTRRLFYVYHPVLGDRVNLASACPSRGEQTIVLGCYVHGQAIYIFQVTDARLQGVHEVTAAHETLHAAYERLPTAKRQRIDKLTAQVLASSNDERLKSTIASYRQQDPAIIPNELHSILGTEVRVLPVELENYYRQYFRDRSHIVGLSEGYENEFTKRKAAVAEDDKRLQELKALIDSNQRKLNDQVAALAALRESLEQAQGSGNIEKYNAGVPVYNNQIRQYNALVVTTQRLIDEYNNLVNERNTIASEEQELLHALEGRPQTIESQ